MKVGLFGGPCAGKTTLAYALVARARQRGLDAVALVNHHHPPVPIDSRGGQRWMMMRAIEEETVAQARRHDLIVCDRTVIDLVYYGGDPPWPGARALSQWVLTYDELYYCPPILDAVPRGHDVGRRVPEDIGELVWRMCEEYARKHGIPFATVFDPGWIEERIDEWRNAILSNASGN